MLLKQLNRDDAEKIFVSGQNVQGETMSVGVFVCWDHRNATSFGSAIVKPAVSTVPLFAGVLAGGDTETFTDLPNNSIGLVQIYGVANSTAYFVGNNSHSAAGQTLVPVAAQYSGGTALISGVGLSWVSNAYFVSRGAVLMDNDLASEGWAHAFVRAM